MKHEFILKVSIDECNTGNGAANREEVLNWIQACLNGGNVDCEDISFLKDSINYQITLSKIFGADVINRRG
jgi:hypothetical protein